MEEPDTQRFARAGNKQPIQYDKKESLTKGREKSQISPAGK